MHVNPAPPCPPQGPPVAPPTCSTTDPALAAVAINPPLYFPCLNFLSYSGGVIFKISVSIL